jgi:mannose-6-phosphate isomerase-like protein (cupin superfamily)
MPGEPYYREKGVKHNVINVDNKIITFIEVEIKNN